MTLYEMKTCAAETLSHFMRTMPNVPFVENDIIIEFVTQDKIVEKYMELQSKYAPEHIINDSQIQDLANNVFANALIGRKKSAVVVCIDPTLTKADMRRNLFHEYMHIFCAKTEIDGEHFIDIYGTGATKETKSFDANYDGYISAGYKLWSEFIANYYAIKHTDNRIYTFKEAQPSIEMICNEVTNENLIESKNAFAYPCSYMFNCIDIDLVITKLSEPNFIWDDNEANGTATRRAFRACMEHIQSQLRNEKPWKISEKYIYELGVKFLEFRMDNSLYLENM